MHRDREMCHRNVSQMLETRKRRKKLALRNEKWGDPRGGRKGPGEKNMRERVSAPESRDFYQLCL